MTLFPVPLMCLRKHWSSRISTNKVLRKCWYWNCRETFSTGLKTLSCWKVFVWAQYWFNLRSPVLLCLWKVCWYYRTLVQHEKAAKFLTYWKLFSSDTRQSMKRRIATERLFKIYITRCGYTWFDESKWPQEWPISPITIIYLKIPSERWNLSVYTRLGFESWYKQIPKHLNERTI